MLKRWSIIGGAAVAVLVALAGAQFRPQPARADSYIYSAQTRQIKVCNLLLESFQPLPPASVPSTYAGLENADPHVFYVLDARTDLKPRGWELVNPLAPRAVDDKIQQRWAFLDPTHPYTVGQAVTKNMACYWEVYLSDTPLEDLLQFDLIFITSHIGATGPGATPTNVQFLPEDREKLAKLVDMGGIVWLEDCWLMRIEKNIPGTAFFLDINFSGVSLSGYQGKPRFSGEVADFHHPLLNSPYRLTEEEINRLGDKNVDDYRIVNLLQNGPPDLGLFPIVFNAGGRPGQAFSDPPTLGKFPYIAGGRYGDGLILVTSGDTGCDINDWIKEPPSFSQARLNPQRPDRNGGAFCGPDLWRAPAEDLKFAYNMLNWASCESNFRKGPRRTGYTKDEVTAPLAPTWQVPLSKLPKVQGLDDRLVSAPVVWRNVAYFATEGGWLIAVDSLPYEDRDGDGNPNDGDPDGIPPLFDLTPATPYDILWAQPIGVRPSALFVGTVTKPDPNNANASIPVDALIFTTSNGDVQAWEAMPTDPVSRRLLPQTQQLWTQTLTPPAGLTFRGASSAVVSRGVCYVTARYSDGTDTAYHLHMIDPATGGIPGALSWWTDTSVDSFGRPREPDTDPTAPPRVRLRSVNDARGLSSELPPVAAALIRDDRTGTTADVAYTTLPTGQLAAATIEVKGEVAKAPSRQQGFDQGAQYIDTDGDGTPDQTRFRLDFEWVPGSLLPAGRRPMAIEYDGAQVARDSGNNPYPPLQLVPDSGDPTLANSRSARCFIIPRVVLPGHRVVVDRYYPDMRFGQGPRTFPYYGLVPGYAGGTPPAIPGELPVRAPVLSGVAVGTGDTVYFSSGSGIIQAVNERGGGGHEDVIKPGLARFMPAITDRNQVLWSYSLNAYTEQGPLDPNTNRPTGYTRANLTQGWVGAYPRVSPQGIDWVPLPPAVTNQMVYVPMNYVDMSTAAPRVLGGALFAFDREAEFYVDLTRSVQSLTLPQPENISAAVVPERIQVWQYVPEEPVQGGDPSGNWRQVTRDFWEYDPATRRIHFKQFDGWLTASLPMPAGSADYPNTPYLPVWVDVDGSGPQGPLAPRPYRLCTGAWAGNLSTAVNSVGPGQTFYDNLVWRFPDAGNTNVRLSKYASQPVVPGLVPGGISAPPTVSGGIVYLGTGDGRVFALDADTRDGKRLELDPGTNSYLEQHTLVDNGWNEEDNLLRAEDPQNLGQNPPKLLAMSRLWPPLQADNPRKTNPPSPDDPRVPGQLRSEFYAPDVLWCWPETAAAIGPSMPPMAVAGGVSATSSVAVVGGYDTSAATGPTGMVYGFAEPVYAVGDANRMLNVTREGRLLWKMAETVTRSEKYSGQANYGTTPANVTVTQKALNRPATASRLSADTVLVSDTGNNRVVAVDRGGSVLWNASEIYDPYNLLAAGEAQVGTGYNGEADVPVSQLSTPTDAVQWLSPDIVNGQLDFNVRVRHTLIADAGNHRVIEIVDKFGPTQAGYLQRYPNDPARANALWYHVVVFASQTNVGHREPWPGGSFRPQQRYEYTSVQPVSYVRARDARGNFYNTYALRVMATISNWALFNVKGVRREKLGASLVLLEGDPQQGTGLGVAPFKAYILAKDPAEPGYVSRIGEPRTQGDPLTRAMENPVTIRRFRVKQGAGGTEEWHDLYVDATGIYEWKVDPSKLASLPIIEGNAIGTAQWVNPDYMHTQFWRETYRAVVKKWVRDLQQYVDPAVVVPQSARSFQFHPSAVSMVPGGGWVVANRALDNALSGILSKARPSYAGRIQVFQIRSAPTVVPPGEISGDYNSADYTPNDDPDNPTTSFGYAITEDPNASPPKRSIGFLFGPKVYDLQTGNDLGLDLVNPTYVVRTE